ncbi:MAG: NAD(P)-dependent oxidoreductase [Alicyclobacillus macrosporangiidus]|nr:NAD(P)-dependent oxidoreductase [Alicyclobacillus macrosporangiidus]
MIRTLLRKGYSVGAYDISRDALDRAARDGAIPYNSLQEAVLEADYILLSLPAPQHVRETVGVIAETVRAERGVTLIDFSTIDPATAKDCAQICEEHGISHLEAPVSGGPQGANNGTLAIMVGGRKETFEQARPLLEDLGSNVYYLGETGTAALVKLCNNVVVGATAVALSEAFALASAGGVPPRQLAEVLSKSVGGSRTLEVFGRHLIEGDYSSPTFSLGLMHKDLGLFVDTARKHGITSLIGNLTYQLYTSAQRHGWQREDHTVVCRVIEELSGRPIQR